MRSLVFLLTLFKFSFLIPNIKYLTQQIQKKYSIVYRLIKTELNKFALEVACTGRVILQDECGRRILADIKGLHYNTWITFPADACLPYPRSWSSPLLAELNRIKLSNYSPSLKPPSALFSNTFHTPLTSHGGGNATSAGGIGDN